MAFPLARLLRAYLWAAAAIVAGVFLLYALFPSASLYQALTHEDSFVQDLQAILLFLAFLLGALVLARRGRKASRAYWWFPATAFLGFLEETSFGESVFRFPRPELLGKHVDSIHDLGEIALRALNRIPLGGLLGNAMLLGAVYAGVRWRVPARARRLVNDHPPFAFLFIGVGLYVAGCLSDFKIVVFPGHEMLEEVWELDGAIAILLAAVTMAA